MGPSSAAALQGVREETGLWECSGHPAPWPWETKSPPEPSLALLRVEVETLPPLGGEGHWLQVLSFPCSPDFLSWETSLEIACALLCQIQVLWEARATSYPRKYSSGTLSSSSSSPTPFFYWFSEATVILLIVDVCYFIDCWQGFPLSQSSLCRRCAKCFTIFISFYNPPLIL